MLTRRTFTAIALLILPAGFMAAPGAGAADLDLSRSRSQMSVESAPGAAAQVIPAAFRDAVQAELCDAVAIEYFDGGSPATRSSVWRWCAPASWT